MSLTPLDESDNRSRDRQRADEESDSRTRLDRLLAPARTVLKRIGAALRARLTSDDEATEPRMTAIRDASPGTGIRLAADARPALSSGTESPTLVAADQSHRSRDRLATSEGPDRDRPKLEATWEEGRLTLSEPGDQDAEISSDTWADVEP